MKIQHAWLFRIMNNPPVKRLVPDAIYYWLLDRFSDNNGWRPLSVRERGAIQVDVWRNGSHTHTLDVISGAVTIPDEAAS